jgi:hypothetical protein
MGCLMCAKLALDDTLVEAARRVGKHKTKKEAVTAALEEYIKRRKQLRILDMVGKVEYWDDYYYKALRHRKPVRRQTERGRHR